MKDSTILWKISQGMYVLTTNGGGCVVDAVSQVSASENPLIAVSVMKKNYTNELMHNNEYFALSVLGMNCNTELIKTFGFNSMRDINKFENIENGKEYSVIINEPGDYVLPASRFEIVT